LKTHDDEKILKFVEEQLLPFEQVNHQIAKPLAFKLVFWGLESLSDKEKEKVKEKMSPENIALPPLINIEKVIHNTIVEGFKEFFKPTHYADWIESGYNGRLDCKKWLYENFEVVREKLKPTPKKDLLNELEIAKANFLQKKFNF
jgi:hypothetical protein